MIYDKIDNCVHSDTIESDKININQLSSESYTIPLFYGGRQMVEKLRKE